MAMLVTATYLGGPSGDWITRFRFDPLLSATAQDAVDTVKLFFDEFQVDRSNTITVVLDTTVTIVDNATNEPTGTETVSGYSLVGGSSGEPLPWQTQALVWWNSGAWVGGRQVRGKTFIGALTESANDNTGNVSSTVRSHLALAAGHLLSPIDGQFEVWSRAHTASYPIQSATVTPRWAFLRSRR